MKAPLRSLLALGLLATSSSVGLAQSGSNTTSPFLGLWCIDNDPTQRASITGRGLALMLRVEKGATSTGVIPAVSSHQVSAAKWATVGHLSIDEERISWSDGTTWIRCLDAMNIQGTWYADGDPTRPNIVNQRNGTLALRNEGGQTGSGSFTSRNRIAVLWSGILVSGTILADQRRIRWDNGTFWTR